MGILVKEIQNVPPPNGFTKAIRRCMALLSGMSFFSLLYYDFTGKLVKDVPFAIYVLLSFLALMMFDKFAELFGSIKK